MRTPLRAVAGLISALSIASISLSAQAPALPAGTPQAPEASPTSSATAMLPPGYVIGPDDVLTIVFWHEKDMSLDVTVRPDGHISMPLLNDVNAAGLTPSELCDVLTDHSKQYIEDPNVTVIVKQINSRKVYVTGEVMKPGPYPLTGSTTVLQMLATAGGLREYADEKGIMLMRVEKGRTVAYPFNYRDVIRRKNLFQNRELKPGDTIVVP